MSHKRTIAVVGAIVIAGATLSGCSANAGSTDPNKVTYMTWEAITTNAALDKTMAKFEKSSGVEVDRIDTPGADYSQKLSSLIISKKAPSFFWCTTQEEQNLASEGLLFDWSKYLKKGDGLVASKFAPGSLDLWKTPDGDVDGIPTLANTYGFFYNKSSFEKAGIPAPQIGWTYDDFFSDLTKLKASDPSTTPLVTQWQLLDSPQGVSAYATANGGAPLFNDPVDVTKVSAGSTFREGAKKFAAAIKAGEMTNPDYDGSNATAAFANGGIPLMFGGQWLEQLIEPNKPNFDYGFAPWPVGTKNSTQPIEANGVCSPSTLSNPSATWKAISYMDSTGFDDVMKSVPVAPIAYLPGSSGYFENLQAGDDSSKSVAATAEYELGVKNKFVTTFLQPWATRATNVVTSSYNAALDGKGPVDPGIDSMVSGIQGLIGK